MRKLPAVCCLAMFAFSITSAVHGGDVIKDATLETAIKDVLKKKPADKLTDADLRNVYILKAGGDEKGPKIATLAGLEKCVNLALFHAPDNQIKDLKPLAGLKNIQSLDLTNNQIQDLTPLAGLDRLQYLQLRKNQIEKIDAVKGLVKLFSLSLAENKVKNLTALEGLKKLSSLYLQNNQVADITPLAKVTWLSSLDLRNNTVSNLSPLSKLTELRYTFLQGNPVKDVTPLVTMAQADAKGDKRFAPYWNLYLSGKGLDAKAKGQLEELKKIGVRLHVE